MLQELSAYQPGADKDAANIVDAAREIVLPRFADKLEVVSDVKLPIGADSDAAVSVVVAREPIFPRFADKLLVVTVELARAVKIPSGADKDAAVIVDAASEIRQFWCYGNPTAQRLDICCQSSTLLTLVLRDSSAYADRMHNLSWF